VLLCGDFNVNVRETPDPSTARAGTDFASTERFVLRGTVPHGELPAAFAPLRFDTGYREDGGLGEGEATWSGGAASLAWGRRDGSALELRDAYEGVNRGAFDPGPGSSGEGGCCGGGVDRSGATGAARGSSHNSARVETIDFLWYDAVSLAPVARSPLACPWPDGSPDTANPSDHIPLAVAFELLRRGN